MSKFYNNVKTLLLLGLLSTLIVWIGSFWGTGGVMLAIVFAAVTNFVSFFFSDKIALAAMRAEQVGPGHKLHDIVERLAQRANMPAPRVYVSPQAAPNAFATGRSPRHAAVCATDGLLHMLSDDEVAAVMAHELAHVRHRDVLIQTVAATIGAAISGLGYIFMFGGTQDDEGDSHPLAALAVMILGPLAAGLIQAAISRSREFNADTVGGEIVGDPMHLATALEKIHAAARQIPLEVNPAYNALFIAEPLNPMRSVANLFQTHPPIEQRLLNLIGAESTGQLYNAPRGRGFRGGAMAW